MHGVGLVGVRRVALLPQELSGPQEQPGAQLPAHHVRPLVQQQGQVPVGRDPLRHHLADDGLGRGPDDQGLLKLLAARVRHDGEFRSEALNVLGFALEVGLRDEQREVRVLVPGVLDPLVERGLEQLPDPVPVRPDDHGALRRPAIDQLRLGHQLVVPGGEVLTLRSNSALVACHVKRLPACAGTRRVIIPAAGSGAACA